MRKLLIAALMVAGPAMADDMLFEGRDFTVRLMEKPCADREAAAVIARFSQGESRAALVEHAGKAISACWVTFAEGEGVLVADGSGMGAKIPAMAFKRKPGV